MTLLKFLPEDGEFKTQAERGGRWPQWKQMLADSVNMQTNHLAWYLADLTSRGGEDGEDLRFDPEPYMYVDPIDIEIRREQEQREAEQAAQTEPDLVEAGWM